MKLKYNAPVTLTFTLIAVAVFLIDLVFIRTLSAQVLSMPGRGAFSFAHITDYFRIITYSFAHGGFDHLLGNFSFILLLGPILEEKYGSFPLAAMMAVTALVIGLAQGLLFQGSLIGASGLVFMMIILISFTNIRKGELPMTLILIVLLFVAKEVFNAITQPDNHISEMAHISGGICGIIFGIFIHSADDQSNDKTTTDDSLKV